MIFVCLLTHNLVIRSIRTYIRSVHSPFSPSRPTQSIKLFNNSFVDYHENIFQVLNTIFKTILADASMNFNYEKLYVGFNILTKNTQSSQIETISGAFLNAVVSRAFFKFFVEITHTETCTSTFAMRSND